MKRFARLLAIVWTLLSFGWSAQAETVGGADASAPSALPFLGKHIAAEGMWDSPTFVEGSPPLEGERLLLVKFVVRDGGVFIRDLMEYMGCFRLEGENADAYEALAFMPKNMLFLAPTGVFATAQEQTGFQLLFCIPEALALADLFLVIEDPDGAAGRIPMGEIEILPEG